MTKPPELITYSSVIAIIMLLNGDMDTTDIKINEISIFNDG